MLNCWSRLVSSTCIVCVYVCNYSTLNISIFTIYKIFTDKEMGSSIRLKSCCAADGFLAHAHATKQISDNLLLKCWLLSLHVTPFRKHDSAFSLCQKRKWIVTSLFEKFNIKWHIFFKKVTGIVIMITTLC